MHAEIKIGDSLVMLGQAGGRWTPRSAALYLWVDDVDATYARALHAGATSKASPRTSRTDTAMPESSIRTASRGGSVLRSNSARLFYFHESSTSTPRKVEYAPAASAIAESCRLLSGANGVALTTTLSPFRMRLDPRRLTADDYRGAEGIAGPTAPRDRQIKRRAAIPYRRSGTRRRAAAGTQCRATAGARDDEGNQYVLPSTTSWASSRSTIAMPHVRQPRSGRTTRR